MPTNQQEYIAVPAEALADVNDCVVQAGRTIGELTAHLTKTQSLMLEAADTIQHQRRRAIRYRIALVLLSGYVAADIVIGLVRYFAR